MKLRNRSEYSNFKTRLIIEVTGDNVNEKVIAHDVEHALAETVNMFHAPCIVAGLLEHDDCAPGQGTDTIESIGTVTVGDMTITVSSRIITTNHVTSDTAGAIKSALLDIVVAAGISELQKAIHAHIEKLSFTTLKDHLKNKQNSGRMTATDMITRFLGPDVTLIGLDKLGGPPSMGFGIADHAEFTNGRTPAGANA